MWRLLFLALLCIGPARAESNIPVPDGYVLQDLEPTGGQIARPKDWNYHQQPTRSGWLWVISPEDPRGKFDTGWQAQALVGVEKTTKRPTREFALNFLNEKRRSGRVLRDCPTIERGSFAGTCIETIEGKSRFIYSVLWGRQNLDMVYVITFGAPEAEWDQVSEAANTFSTFKPASADFIERMKHASR